MRMLLPVVLAGEERCDLPASPAVRTFAMVYKECAEDGSIVTACSAKNNEEV